MIEHNIELRRHVERIVRPIRGSAHRKTRMREELLVHLTSVLDEELVARDGDVAVATAAAIARFGDPAALRVDLQATVPVVERVLCAQLVPGNTRFGRRPGESVPRFCGAWGPGPLALTPRYGSCSAFSSFSLAPGVPSGMPE